MLESKTPFICHHPLCSSLSLPAADSPHLWPLYRHRNRTRPSVAHARKCSISRLSLSLPFHFGEMERMLTPVLTSPSSHLPPLPEHGKNSSWIAKQPLSESMSSTVSQAKDVEVDEPIPARIKDRCSLLATEIHGEKNK